VVRTELGPLGERFRRLVWPHAAVVTLTAPPVLLLASVTPSAFLLPVLSLTAMGVAGVTALLAWACSKREPEDRVTLWDISGAFALIACGAGIFSEPENVLQMFGVTATP
jgi:hypothetical protein